MRAWVLLLFLPVATAQVPGIEDALTDGVPFELDSNRTLSRLVDFDAGVTGQAVHDCVDEITHDFPNSYRLMGTPTQNLFVEQYQDVFADLGLASDLQHFDRGAAGLGPANAGAVLGNGGTNIVGVLPGTDPSKWVVIGGHYDTREATIGALDNTSGICTVKEIARAMVADTQANGPYEASVVFLWYDGEEWGLYGAIAFAEDPSVAATLLGMKDDQVPEVLVSQSFDMPGINYPARNIWVQYPEDSQPTIDMEKNAVLNLRTAPIHEENEWRCWSYGCYEELKQRSDFDQVLLNFTNYQFLVRETAYDLMQFPPELVWVYDDHYGRSDHIPLIAKGAAGMRIQGSHDEEYPCYHQPCDTLEWLYQQTGSKDLLIQAYDVEASVGGAVAMYVALHGDHGRYGEKYWLDQDPAPRNTVVLDAPAPEDPLREESPTLGLLAFVFVIGLLARRRNP